MKRVPGFVLNTEEVEVPPVGVPAACFPEGVQVAFRGTA
jgi:hypothetical protein